MKDGDNMETANPSDLAVRIRHSTPGRTMAIVLRHAERTEIVDIRQSSQAQLTDGGRKASMELGKMLPSGHLYRLFHSHSDRCKETAELICQGLQEAGVSAAAPSLKYFLGCPFMLNLERIQESINNVGMNTFLASWFKGEVDTGILAPSKGAFQDLLKAIVVLSGKESPGVVDICVTHDWNLVLLLSRLCIDQEIPWPRYLESVIIELGAGEIILSYQGKECRFAIDEQGGLI